MCIQHESNNTSEFRLQIIFEWSNMMSWGPMNKPSTLQNLFCSVLMFSPWFVVQFGRWRGGGLKWKWWKVHLPLQNLNNILNYLAKALEFSVSKWVPSWYTGLLGPCCNLLSISHPLVLKCYQLELSGWVMSPRSWVTKSTQTHPPP